MRPHASALGAVALRFVPGAAVALLVATSAGAAILSIDPGESELGFTVGRPGETIEGRAPVFSGTIRFDARRPDRDPEVRLQVVSESLVTGNRIRDRKMRRNHLEVDLYPVIGFHSTSIEIAPGPEGRDADGAAPLRPGESRHALVEGILELRGIERSILFPVAIRYDNGHLEAEGDVSFRLTDHDIPIPRFLWLVLDDAVTIHFRFVAGPEGARLERERD